MNHHGTSRSHTPSVALKTTLPVTPHWGFLLQAANGVSLRISESFSGRTNSLLGSLELRWLERDAGGSCEYSCFLTALLLGVECLRNSC